MPEVEAAPPSPDAANEAGRGLVFAGGCPRSGLTLLRRLLSVHPGVRTGPDTGAAPATAFQWRGFAEHLGGLHREHFGLDGDAVAAIMGRFLDGVLRADGETRLILEKTSLNIVAFEALAHISPGARFIHVVRDGRDVAASLLDRDWRNPANGQLFAHVRDPKAAMTYWAQLAAIGLAAEQAMAPGRVMRVRYEDMAAAPETTQAQLCAFLGLDWPLPDEPAAVPINDEGYLGLERESLPLLLGPMTDARIGRWRARFSASEAATLEQIGRSPLETLDYL